MKTLVAFDLDDTLLPEAQFLRSGIRHIAEWLHRRYPRLSPARIISCMDNAVFTHSNHYSALENYLESVKALSHVDLRMVVEEFRNHLPDPEIYHLAPSLMQILSQLHGRDDIRLALITDGRPTTQRNKIQAAGLYEFFNNSDILISGETGFDKTYPDNFLMLMRKYAGIKNYHYIADNPAKDFVHPSKLGWHTHLSHSFPLMIHPHSRT